MDTQSPITTPESLDISNQLSDITSSMTETLAPFIFLSMALTVIFVIMYIVSVFRRRKVENAVLDMQKILHEMNEREKARTKSQPTPERPESRKEIIADSSDSHGTNTIG
jgi:heme exporter protein D